MAMVYKEGLDKFMSEGESPPGAVLWIELLCLMGVHLCLPDTGMKRTGKVIGFMLCLLNDLIPYLFHQDADWNLAIYQILHLSNIHTTRVKFIGLHLVAM